MKTEEIYEHCRLCHGKGTVLNQNDPDNPFEETCTRCNGERHTAWGELEGLHDVLDDILDKLKDIHEKLDEKKSSGKK